MAEIINFSDYKKKKEEKSMDEWEEWLNDINPSQTLTLSDDELFEMDENMKEFFAQMTKTLENILDDKEK